MPVVRFTRKTDDVTTQVYGPETVHHTLACDHASAGDACVGNCAIIRPDADNPLVECRQCQVRFDIKDAIGHAGTCGSDRGFNVVAG